MTNWGAHNLDIARWVLGAKGPSAVAAFGGRYEIKDGGETPDVQEVIYSFPNCVVTWSGREVNRTRDEYLAFHGTLGTLNMMREGFKVIPEVWKERAAATRLLRWSQWRCPAIAAEWIRRTSATS
jgi:predicted dehydrogenase